MRAFLAIDLPDDIADRLAGLMAGFGVGRVVPPENYHLTLAFLDDQPEAVLAELHDELRGWMMPEMDLTLSGLGTFGHAAPRLLYAAIAPDPRLAGVRKGMRRACRATGIVLPHERFVPHVTLARFRQDQALAATVEIADLMARASAVFPMPRFAVDAVCLYRSHLSPEGARHDLLARFPDCQAGDH